MRSEWTFQSSHLHRGQYDDETQVLTIQFTNGAIYDYYRVPPHAADTLRASGSSQDYFNNKIKGVYSYSKMADGVTKTGRTSRRRI
jgi:lysyl-tRNA synthetase class 2